jgi:hypothetical protein
MGKRSGLQMRARGRKADGVSEIGIGDWLVRQIRVNVESLQRTSHVLF